MIIKEQWDLLNEHLQECVDKGVFPGASFAIVTPTEARITHVGNRQNVPSVIPNDENTIWDLASITKVFATTSCILKLMEQGKLTLKTKVCEVLPEFSQKELTILHCITHTSGLPADITGYKNMTKDQMLDFVKNVQCEKVPGTEVMYSDINFILLGQIIETLTGSFKDYATENLFKPLNMLNTGFNPESSPIDNFAAYEDIQERGGIIKGVVHDGKAFKLGGVSGHAGVFSTINDLSHFVYMLLNDGVYFGRRIFSPSTIDLLKKCQTSKLNEKRSIGWVLSDPNYSLGDFYSEHTLFHTGFSGCSLLIDLDRHVGFICTCNRVHPSRSNTKIFQERNNIHNLAYQCFKNN
ncbi:serine hydrolase domain-containing protein [Anaerorhabdus furcosa]|uniref:CubicO group peptidase, beta-lactamase class C family n=1 Tax=Anaerorhabdus furcosa TaxID=118967 RepID=A0A1T4MWZ8_9FIRM|nr:serine hydrolase domain-containing protein [Anaerorhabdus furcosa]SJZ71384.1 CubicO group peptidase, beta-lactamase class C family [Anaerorhabdus furcosa]